MDEYQLALAQLGQRINAANLYLHPEFDALAALQMARLTRRQQEFQQQSVGQQGFTKYHPALFINVETLVDSLVTHQSATRCRGNGRVSSIADTIRSNGNGAARAMASVREFLELGQPDEVYKDKRTGIVYPVDEVVENTSTTLSRLTAKLVRRSEVLKELSAPFRKTRKPSEEEVQSLLLRPGWDDLKIVTYTNELVARSVAFAIPESVRKEMVNQPDMPFTDALDQINWKIKPQLVAG